MDSERLKELYRQHAAALVLYARQWCNAPDDALQEALLALANCQPAPRDPVAWLFTATKRRALNIARAEARRQQHQTRAAEERGEWFVGPAADTNLAASESMAEAVAAGLESLADDERELVVARVWGNLAFEQLGQLLDCSTSSAHRRYLTALAKLRSAVEENSEQSPEGKSREEMNTRHPTDAEPNAKPHRKLITGES